MIPNFAEYELKIDTEARPAQKAPIRSTIGFGSSDQKELMNSIEMLSLRKKMEDSMNNEYQ